MDPYKILQQLKVINNLAQQQTKELAFQSHWESLYTTILQDISSKGIGSEKEKIINCLKEIKDNFDNIRELQVTNATNRLEILLLPVFQLIHIYEQNGEPKDHAKKLGSIFSTFDDVLDYLCIFANQNQRKYMNSNNVQLVHKACLFTLPENFDFKKNNSIKKLVKDNMQDPEFRRLLPNLAVIEQLTPKLDPAIKKPKKTSSNELLIEIDNVKAIIKNYKEIKDEINRGRSITPEQQDKYDQYGNQLLSAQLDLVKVSANLERTFYDLNIYELKAYEAKYKFETQPEFRYFLEHGLQPKDYNHLLDLTRIDDDARIPPVVINGSEIGYSGYYLRRLNVQSLEDATMAACLGKLSDCCQSLSGETGEPCTIHGLTSPEGGFYIVCKGDENNHSIYDELICQSWVWRSKSDALIIDSIEANLENDDNREDENLLEENLENDNNAVDNSSFEENLENDSDNEEDNFSDGNSETDSNIEDDGFFDADSEEDEELGDHPNIAIVKAFYYELAYKLSYEYNIPKINCGRTSGISKYIIGDNFFSSYEYPKDYNGYRDSHKQAMICDKNSLYLLPGKEEIFFENCKKMHIPMQSPVFIKMICFAIKNNREDLLEKYCNLFNLNGEGKNIISKCKEYLKTVYLNQLICKIIKDPYLLLVVRSQGKNILHELADTDPRLLKQLLNIYKTKKDILVLAITEKDQSGDSLLHIAADKPELLKQLLEIFPTEQNALSAIKEVNADNKKVLDLAVENAASLEQLYKLYTLYPPEERLDAIGGKGPIAVGLLFYGILNIELLKNLLSILPEKDRVEATMMPNVENSNGLNTLYHKIDLPNFFNLVEQILLLFPEKDRIKIITTQNQGKSIFDKLYLLDFISLIRILKLLPEEDRLHIITKKNNKSENILGSSLIANPDWFKQILDLLPENERINIKNQYNKQNIILFSSSNANTNSTENYKEIVRKNSI